MTRDGRDDGRDDGLDDVTPEERVRAQALARLVDDMLDGQPPPPALPFEDRLLLEASTLLRTTLQAPAVPAPVAPAPVAPTPVIPAPVAPTRTRASWRARASWWGGALAAAAAAVLALQLLRPIPEGPVTATRPTVATTRRPRSPDALVGPIARHEAGEARARLDLLYADRLRELRSARRARGSR